MRKLSLVPTNQCPGLQFFDKVIAVEQSPFRTDASFHPATYTGVLAGIRDLFAELRLRERGDTVQDVSPLMSKAVDVRPAKAKVW